MHTGNTRWRIFQDHHELNLSFDPRFMCHRLDFGWRWRIHISLRTKENLKLGFRLGNITMIPGLWGIHWLMKVDSYLLWRVDVVAHGHPLLLCDFVIHSAREDRLLLSGIRPIADKLVG